MRKIVFATNNKHKLIEIRSIIKDKFKVLSLSDIGFDNDIPETGNSFAENASIKSQTIYKQFKLDCFSDDTGLEIDALDGKPGVYSARYAGEKSTYEENVNKILLVLKGNKNRKAEFSTVISLILDGKEFQFEGRVPGQITTEKRGKSGFGYDPVFQPDGFDITFAEMSADTKNKMSHRGKAVKKLIAFLNEEL
ncbi:MAG: non-canonical purine NTP diphosphatase [Bacteroidetes bacterium]|nr:non-canonical purine NTP diphosphatase [Bacteroidota bacterium]MBL6944231.1 non-canonical purine NTP diphosphatase [Bacteroidales bacterium]